MLTSYYDADGVTLYKGVCQDVMPALDLSSDTVVIADPPYGQTSLVWDRWQDVWLDALPATAKSLWCFGTMRMFLAHGHCFADRGWKLSQDVVWEKHNGSSFHNDRFRRVHESVCHFYRGEWSSIYHVAPVTMNATAKTVRRKTRPTHMGDIGAGHYTSFDGGPKLMRSVIFQRSMHGKAVHPTQKPVELVKPLIQYAARPGSTVLVPFAGSGSELIAAKELGFRAIGMEVREEYCEAAARRLAA
jgi:site-specific DNA-methyltransferase (adenine-specific)